MIDITLLKIMKERASFLKLIHAIPKTALDEKTVVILEDFNKYFEKFQTHTSIDLTVFIPCFKRWHPQVNEEQFATYIGILRNIQSDVDEETKTGILGELFEVGLGTRVANLVSEYENGELEYPLVEVIQSEIDTYRINTRSKQKFWNDTPIGDLLLEDINAEGLTWPLETLNNVMRPLRPGDFGIIAGRPDKGKTTFLAHAVAHMASQLPEERNVLWLNNESTSGKIVKRVYQGALGITISEMTALSQKGRLIGMYHREVGRLDKVRVVDIHGYHIGQVEALISNSNPGLVIYDMIDNVRGFGHEQRTDLALEKMYQWARENCVKYGAVGLAASQISSEGDGLMFPSMSMLKDSKTGKQGACDFQLMIGASNEPTYQNSRFLSIPKNKLRRDGATGDCRAEVRFIPGIARYADLSQEDRANLGIISKPETAPNPVTEEDVEYTTI